MYIIFFLLWVIFNGQLTLEIAVFGIIISSAMYAFLCKFMNYNFRKDIVIIKEAPLIVQYLFVLLWEIIKANMATIRFIMAKKNKNQPVLVSFETNLKTRTAKTILANSITLTPGTITVSLEENNYVIHCLDKSFSKGLEDSSFVRLLIKMEEVALCGLEKEKRKAKGEGC